MSKKIPLRKCIGCGQMKEKKAMVRVLRNTEEQIMLDKTGKLNGRGAYICSDVQCLQKAIKTKGLERALKTAIPEIVYTQLQEQMNES